MATNLQTALHELERQMRESLLREQQHKEEKARLEMEMAKFMLEHARRFADSQSLPKMTFGGGS